ncbi:hypothetical protein QR680_018664 [Steinernema hermaphroditum]|uniref:OBG-type G domain-containing protein n=1 Tax=Steinernema hermaphroditum TaxID=289476 RepID=A0AA39LR68_9BILA|nr:hypothetical protein QR680_018664 [Steinernema hermaphroditum]
MRVTLLRLAKKFNDRTIVDVDRISIHVKGGNGGAGLARYNGVGGFGGNVYLLAKPKMRFDDISKQLREQGRAWAPHGTASISTKLVGGHAQHLMINVPVGVECVDRESRILLARCTKPYERYLVAQGGEGGNGDNGYAGVRGEKRNIELHLKLRPNIGLVGFPNAGKSTLMKALVPKKKVKIAAYPFTTTKPQMCYVSYEDEITSGDEEPFSLTIADLPGLIEGASKNRGRGDSFLKHLEYSDIIVMVVDVTGFQLRVSLTEPYRTALETVAILNQEIENYDLKLLQKPAVLVLNKTDLPGGAETASQLQELLRSQKWAESLSEELRPSNPMTFDEVIPASAKNFELGSLKPAVRKIYECLRPLRKMSLFENEQKSKGKFLV